MLVHVDDDEMVRMILRQDVIWIVPLRQGNIQAIIDGFQLATGHILNRGHLEDICRDSAREEIPRYFCIFENGCFVMNADDVERGFIFVNDQSETEFSPIVHKMKYDKWIEKGSQNLPGF